ncbi:hypothetical protein M1D52_07325 [Olivibacter sp. SA151]|uniref:ApeA N-terminal domain 1-containing protein n=1 Tax=Olivibacter jilunii TaxID=985016 RepID=UPI003F14D9E7
MQEANVFKGYWFIPNKPKQKVAGILHFTPYETLKLELIGGFETPKDSLKNMASDVLTTEDVIWGIDQDAKNITLVNCRKYGSLNFSSEFPMISYTVQHAIIGIHISAWDEKTFFKLNVELPLLTKWVNYRRIGFSMS